MSEHQLLLDRRDFERRCRAIVKIAAHAGKQAAVKVRGSRDR
jgi:hypothetical protein